MNQAINSIRSKIIEIINENYLNNNDNVTVTPETNFVEDLGFNSLKMIQLIIEIENQFGVELSDDDLDMDKIITVEKLSNFIVN